MKLLVCGGRDYNDQAYIFSVLDDLHTRHAITHIIHGNAAGADTAAGIYARAQGVSEVVCPAQWGYYGRAAGFQRNHSMLMLGPDAVLAFPGGRGTDGMVRLAKQHNVTVIDHRTQEDANVHIPV